MMSYSFGRDGWAPERHCFDCLRPEHECVCHETDNEYEAYLEWFVSAVERGEIAGGLEHEDWVVWQMATTPPASHGRGKTMTSYFIVARSFAAPFFSDSSTDFQEADSHEAALEAFAASYSHPAGLYAAEAYESADAYHKGELPLSQWLCNHEIAKAEIARKHVSGFSYLGNAPGVFEINGAGHTVENPKQGRVVQP